MCRTQKHHWLCLSVNIMCTAWPLYDSACACLAHKISIRFVFVFFVLWIAFLTFRDAFFWMSIVSFDSCLEKQITFCYCFALSSCCRGSKHFEWWSVTSNTDFEFLLPQFVLARAKETNPVLFASQIAAGVIQNSKCFCELFIVCRTWGSRYFEETGVNFAISTILNN